VRHRAGTRALYPEAVPRLASVLRLAARLARTAGDGRRRRRPARDRGSDRYPGDFEGAVQPEYAPDPDGRPDPGEIVWSWVPFEEDHAQGKDRPVLVVGRDGPWLLGLMLSSRDHDTRPGRPGEEWLDLGVGGWDAQGRPSEVRLDRVLRLAPEAVRREGAVLDRGRFDEVAGSLRRRPGW
jgi:hypothetical protein